MYQNRFKAAYSSFFIFLVLFAFCSCQTRRSNISQKEKAIEFLRMFESGKMTAFQYIDHQKYIHHDPDILDGFLGMESYIKALPLGSLKVKIYRVIEEKDYVVLHSQIGRFASFDVLRFENEKIVEHWNNKEELIKPNISGRSLLDGTTDVLDIGKTDLDFNKSILKRVSKEVVEEGKLELLPYLYEENYVQHSSYMGDGIEPLRKILNTMTEVKSISTVHLLLAEGDFVFSMSDEIVDGKGTAYFDFFRIRNGKIAEHWDTISEIPARKVWKSSYGKF